MDYVFICVNVIGILVYNVNLGVHVLSPLHSTPFTLHFGFVSFADIWMDPSRSQITHGS